MNELLFYSLIGGLFSLVGGFLLLWKSQLSKRWITVLLSFGAGAFLGAAFLDILPEAIEAADEPHAVFISTLVGFLIFFTMERLLMRYVKGHHEHDGHSDHTESLPFLLILGDSIHNFLDGIVIAIAYVANPALGLPTALAIAAHEVPQEIADFSVLLQRKWKKSTIVAVNVIQSLLTIPGVFVGYYIGSLVEPHLPLLLGGTAGIFLYIAASDLIPELHHQAGHKYVFRVIVPLILSIILIYYLTNLAHGQ